MKNINDRDISSSERKNWISDTNPATAEEQRLLDLADAELAVRQAAGEDIELTELPASFMAREQARQLKWMQAGFAPEAGMKSGDVYTIQEFDDANAAGELGRLPVVLEKAELPDGPGERAVIHTRVRADELGLRHSRLPGEKPRSSKVRIHRDDVDSGEDADEEVERHVEELRASLGAGSRR
jgi:hypothetical protein